MIVRSQPPKTFNPEIKSIPKPVVFTLSNGIPLFNYNMGGQPVFRLELIFGIGSANFANPSIASLTCNMLREGTQGKSSEEINNFLDFYGSHLDIRSGLDYTTVSLYGRAEFLSELLPVVSEVLKEPSFDPAALEKQKQLAVQNLQISQKKTSYWSVRLLRGNIFGVDHPYSRIPGVDEIEKIEPGHLLEFHQQLLANLEAIIISGSYSQGEFERLIDGHLGSIKLSKAQRKVNQPEFKADNITRELKKTTQASIALGLPAISHRAEAYPLHSLVVKLFGGYFGSRLMKTLREDRGLTYGVHGYFVQLRQGEFTQITADVKLEAAQESVNIVKEEIDKLLLKPISALELETVKQYMIGEYINDANTAFDFAGLYKKILLQDLPGDYFDKYYLKISEATIDDIESIKARVLDTARLTTVIVK